MASETLKVGDVVRLKSGGPTMTITNIADRAGTPHAWVSWFTKDGKAEGGVYPLHALTADDGKIHV